MPFVFFNKPLIIKTNTIVYISKIKNKNKKEFDLHWYFVKEREKFQGTPGVTFF